MYASTDRDGSAIAVTGTVLVPTSPWIGLGERPIVAFAVGTQGLGDACAPSRQLAAGSEYEGAFISGLLARGYAVTVTDYQGLGTPGVHTYMNRHVQGTAVLDSIRAAQRLPGTGLAADGPVAIAGYSQGGGASASAAELATTYAPELKLKGVLAGAVPADLNAVAANLDGRLYVVFMLYAVGGLAAGYDLDLGPVLNSHGAALRAQVEEECTIESIAKHPFVRSSTLTRDGRPLTAYLAEEPIRSVVADSRLGQRKPAGVPLYVAHSVLDDVIPYAVGKGLAQRWCAKGANVRFSPNLGPTHIGGAVPSFVEQFAFLEARFAGLPQFSTCWAL